MLLTTRQRSNVQIHSSQIATGTGDQHGCEKKQFRWNDAGFFVYDRYESFRRLCRVTALVRHLYKQVYHVTRPLDAKEIELAMLLQCRLLQAEVYTDCFHVNIASPAARERTAREERSSAVKLHDRCCSTTILGAPDLYSPAKNPSTMRRLQAT